MGRVEAKRRERRAPHRKDILHSVKMLLSTQLDSCEPCGAMKEPNVPVQKIRPCNPELSLRPASGWFAHRLIECTHFGHRQEKGGSEGV